MQLWAEQLERYTGSDTIDPPLEFSIADDVNATFSAWSEVSEVCGDSRLWGGMHFPVSGPSVASRVYITQEKGSSTSLLFVLARATRLSQGHGNTNHSPSLPFCTIADALAYCLHDVRAFELLA